ncbi:GGDEF domain-containing protein [Nocardioides anomalus]|uniref:GGDEF domain-containing protein n=1 Tax=Nocardioides anomalus TaxID=2712223 RepID=A0A6G6WGG5_9ACTN|nr:GGDEF domain-containing protein [Nocardioides anomalus]QIG44247.1 GGDEF domain-containing protein [Nocardioides anomalus]
MTQPVAPGDALARGLGAPYHRLLDWMRPRDVTVAARTVSVLIAVGVAVTVLTLPLQPGTNRPTDPAVLALAALALFTAALMAVASWFFDQASRLAWALCPVTAIAVIVFVDLATHDASVSAQIFFVFPAVYGAALLRRPGAIVMTALCLLGEVVVVFSQLGAREAVLDTAYMASALVTMSYLLVRSGERQDALVTELARLAAIDPLTGLVTRRAFDEALDGALTRPEGDEGTSLVLLDVDEFKSVNDRYGHPGGDQVLVQLSGLLVEASRRGDVVCRLGGDELAVLLPRCTIDVALRRAEDIAELVRAHGFDLGAGDLVKVSVSAGLAHAPTHGSAPEELYAAADAALYQAKRGGRDRVVAHPLPV